MRDLAEKGIYTLPTEAKDELARVFSASFATDAETADTIRRVFDTHGYLMDTHTAVAYRVFEALSDTLGDAPCVVLSTASPYKFVSAVLSALGHTPTGDGFADMKELSRLSGTPVPYSLAKLASAAVHHTDITDPCAMGDYVADTAPRIGGGAHA